MYFQAFDQMRAAVDAGELICIFPEGQITRDGELNPFRPGVLTLVNSKPAPVIPMALRGLWGSLFSRKGGKAFFKFPRRLFAKIDLVVGTPIPAEAVTMDKLHKEVHSLRGDLK